MPSLAPGITLRPAPVIVGQNPQQALLPAPPLTNPKDLMPQRPSLSYGLYGAAGAIQLRAPVFNLSDLAKEFRYSRVGKKNEATEADVIS